MRAPEAEPPTFSASMETRIPWSVTVLLATSPSSLTCSRNGGLRVSGWKESNTPPHILRGRGEGLLPPRRTHLEPNSEDRLDSSGKTVGNCEAIHLCDWEYVETGASSLAGAGRDRGRSEYQTMNALSEEPGPA